MLSDEQLEKLAELFDALSEKHQDALLDQLHIKYFESTGKFADFEEEE